MRIAASLIVLAALSCGAVAAQAADSSTLTPEQQRARPKLAAWVVPWDRTRTRVSVKAQRTQLGTISPAWFELAKSGRAISTRSGAPDKVVLQHARNHDITLMPSIGNGLDPQRVSAMLESKASRARHVQQIVKLVRSSDYAGVDIDYENLVADDRAAFTAFVRSLKGALKAKGKRLSVSVYAATRATRREDAALATDYAAIAKVADEVRLLAYDHHWPCSAAGPVAPIDWVEDSIEYVTDFVPKSKLVLGVPLYGYDWVNGSTSCAASRTWREVAALKVKHRGKYGWSTPWKSRVLWYTAGKQKRTAWFEDAASVRAKAKLAVEHELRGVIAWRMGGEDPAVWAALVAELGAQPAGG